MLGLFTEGVISRGGCCMVVGRVAGSDGCFLDNTGIVAALLGLADLPASLLCTHALP